MPTASGAMNMDRPSPDFAVDMTLSTILATLEVPRGGAANLYFAGTAFGNEGDLVRARLCGQASVAALRLEKAIREEDSRQRRAVIEVFRGLHDQWQQLEPDGTALRPVSKSAA